MSVDGKRHVLDALDTVGHGLDPRAVLLNQAVSRGVSNVDNGCAGIHDGLHHTNQEVDVSTPSILCVERDVIDERLCVRNAMGSALHALVLGDAQLVLHMDGRDAQTRHDTRTLGGHQRLGGAGDILVARTAEGCDHTRLASELANLLHRAEVTRARDGEARLDDVNAQTDKLTGHNKLLLGVHRGAGRLLPVAKRGIEDGDLAAHSEILSGWRLGCRRLVNVHVTMAHAPLTC